MEKQQSFMPIRICHVMGKMNGGGVESMVMNYYRHIDKSKVQFDFIIDKDSSIIPFEEINALGGKIYKVSPYQVITKYINELVSIFKENNYQIVHSHINSLSLLPLSAAKKAGVPIRIAHSHSTSAPGETTKNIVKNILRPMSKVFPTHYCSCSKSAGEWLFGRKLLESERLKIINNGIEVNKFLFDREARESIRKDLNITNNFVVGHTGRLCFQKNQELLITSFKTILNDIPDAVLLLIGDGKADEKLRKLAEDFGVSNKIIFLGNKSDVNRYYSAMDVFAFPSRYEGFGISAIEAQVSGLPVLMSFRVPEEACLTKKCVFVSIEEGITPWVENIVNLEKTIDVNKTTDRKPFIDFKEFNIKKNVETLEQFYFDILKESVSI